MREFKNLKKTVTGSSLDAITMDVQHYSKLGYRIESEHVNSTHTVKSIMPFVVESSYTVHMMKTVEV